jgi:hypothetical protein
MESDSKRQENICIETQKPVPKRGLYDADELTQPMR